MVTLYVLTETNEKNLRTKAHTIKNGPISEIQNILMGQQASTHAIQIISFT